MSAYRHAETGQGLEQELSSVSESHEESDTMHLIASRNSNSTADTAVHFSGNSDSTNDTEQPFDEEALGRGLSQVEEGEVVFANGAVGDECLEVDGTFPERPVKKHDRQVLAYFPGLQKGENFE